MSKDGRCGGQIESSVAVVPDPDTGIHSRKRSHPISSDDTVMDHSGLEESSGKRSRLCVKDGVMQCLRLQGVKKGDSCPPQRVAEELARCLHEVCTHPTDTSLVLRLPTLPVFDCLLYANSVFAYCKAIILEV